ncbi:MAG: hypothetical protein ABW352_00575 [Polyangiales bacterium]
MLTTSARGISARSVAADAQHTAAWVALLPLTFVICGLDSAYIAARWPYGQWAADAVMIGFYVWMAHQGPPRLRALMRYGVVIGLVGESLCSLVFGMYEYRLHNIPLYVPLGHPVIYGAIYHFVREPFVVRHRRALTSAMFVASVGYSLWWLVAAHDVFGAVCALVFVWIVLADAESRTFFLAMYLLVAFLEQVGTGFGAWTWYEYAFGGVKLLPSGNPPSGISIFYFAFDGLCLLAYLKRRPLLRARYRRLRTRLQETPELAQA